MLTDIFANRYSSVVWVSYDEPERRLMIQCFRIIKEQLFPNEKNINWEKTHDKLSMELGLKELSERGFFYPTTYNGVTNNHYSSYSIEKIGENFVCEKYEGAVTPDRFMKERLSFIELAFRAREEELFDINSSLSTRIIEDDIRLSRKRSISGGKRIGVSSATNASSIGSRLRAGNKEVNDNFISSVDELNERLRQAGTNLNYHNGFIQISDDPLVEEQIEREFWHIVSDVMWKNVDTDMKEAIDRRDGNQKDPVFYAARALESTIKIISENKGWTNGKEKGAHSFIDNLGSKSNGNFITSWERNSLKAFFTEIRNPVGHGSGSDEIIELSAEQTNWAIETCMSWVKSLVKRT